MYVSGQQGQPSSSQISGLLVPCLLSAVGSLSINLAPVVVLGLTSVSGLSPSNAGVVYSLRLAGELIAAMLFPWMLAQVIGRFPVICFCLCLMACLGISAMGELALLYAGFTVVGICCGALKLVGTVFVSVYPNRTFAFTFRLAVMLVLGGAAILMFQFAAPPSSHFGLMMLVLAVHAPMLIVCVLMYKPPNVPIGTAPDGNVQFALAGIAIICAFFIVVSGFMAFSAQQAATHGISVSEAVLAIGLAKLLAGLWLIGESLYLRKASSSVISLMMTALMIATLWAVHSSRNLIEFTVAFLALEIVLNRYSARLQSAIVDASPQLGMRTLNLSILGGATGGPFLFGLAVEWNLVAPFIALGSLIIALPWAWQRSLPKPLKGQSA